MAAQPVYGSTDDDTVAAKAMRAAVSRLLDQAGLTRLAVESQSHAACRLALLDGRVATAHPVFQGAIIDQVGGVADARSEPASRHATMIASVLVGRRGQALGLCRRCSLLSIPVAGRQFMAGRLDAAAAAASVAAGIDQAVRHGASVIQLSLAFDPEQGKACKQIVSALSAASARGVVAVVAAGNLDQLASNPILQAPGAIGVVAADPRRLPMALGVLAPSLGRRGLMAPGHQVPGAVPPSSMGWSSGSSMAACFVTATFALLRCSFPHHSVGELLAALLRPGPARTTRSVLPVHLNGDASAALLRLPHPPRLRIDHD